MPPARVRIRVKLNLHPASGQSRLSANDKGNNEMIPGAVQRSPGIYLTAERNSGKPQLGDEGDEIPSIEVVCFQMNFVESYNTSGSEKKIRKG